MMQSSLIAIAILGGTLCSPANSLHLEGLPGVPYRPPPHVEVVCAATNLLPDGLWIYRAVPQEFSPAALSNLMSLCEFQWINLNKPTTSDIADKKLIRFTDKKQRWTRCLEIAPTLGWIEYNADSAPTPAANNVPNPAELEKLAFNILFQLGIDRSLLCDKRSGYETVRGRISPDGHRLSTNVVSRGISCARQIDGVESRNAACFLLVVESNAKIKRLLLNWRRLLPYEPHLVATANELAESIKSGHATLPPQSGNMAGLDTAAKLTVTDITLRYFDIKGSQALDFSYPFAALTLQASLPGTNTLTFYLQCPILSTNRLLSSRSLKH